jgi:hypothetical protein
MSFWAMSFWANVFWANVFKGKCLSGQILSGQMSFWANVVGANVSGQMSLGKCRIVKRHRTLSGNLKLATSPLYPVATGLQTIQFLFFLHSQFVPGHFVSSPAGKLFPCYISSSVISSSPVP